ncbi:MAG TPA: acyl-CoA dehydrogenase family protein [Acidimicrobiales bacterium]|nr:acyl-CoA dehydrogenase family protein [Acidimicrobiales bacterium]
MASPIFTAEHDALRVALRTFVERELAPHADEWESAGDFPDDVFRRMGELGFLGLHFDETDGGQGGDYITMVVLAEEMARCGSGGVSMAVSVQCEYVTPPIAKFGTLEQRKRYLRPAIEGAKIGALGITEPNAGSDVAGMSTKAERDGDEWIVNGRKTFITNGCRADFLLLVARTNTSSRHGGLSLFLVDTDTPGFRVARRLDKVGMLTSDTAELEFDDMRIPGTALLGEEGRGFQQIMWELQGERLAAAAGACAGAQLAIDRTLEFVQVREAFGQRLGDFQAVRHQLAEAQAQVDAVRALTYETAWRVHQGEYPVRLITEAKLLATRTHFEVADTCLQLHGGAGYMADHWVQRMWRDSRLARIGAGADEVMLDYIAKAMRADIEGRSAHVADL